MKNKLNIVFMGTPQFAATCLQQIIATEHSVLGVFCQPDKPFGRKGILKSPEVKVMAQSLDIPIYQPTTLKNDEAYNLIKSLMPDIIVVVAYGKILPKNILELPRYGCINAHGSILPKYRGAAPIQWAIINGESETGVSIIKMNEGMDTGDILSIDKLAIEKTDTSESMFIKLSELSAKALVKILNMAENIESIRTSQNNSKATLAPMLKKQDAKIDWSMTAEQIKFLVNGMYPWPVTYTSINGQVLKIYSCNVINMKTEEENGKIISLKKEILVACGQGSVLKLEEVQFADGKRMEASSFVNGGKLAVNDRFI